MERLSQDVGFSLLKGASQHVDKQIASIIKQKGRNYLSQIAKLHFANTKKAEQYM